MKSLFKTLAMGAFCAGFATLAAPKAHALPSGLGAFPSTDIYTKGNIHLDVDSYSSTNVKTIVLPTQGLTYGVGPDTSGVFGRTEVGYDYNFSSSSPLSFGKRIFGNIKTQLFNNDKQQVRVVAGGWLLGDSTTNPNYLYLLGSKNFTGVGRFHLGYAYAASTGLFQFNNTTSNTTATRGRSSVHLGYDRLITPKLQFCIDYYSGKGPFAGVQPTVYYSVNDKASFGLGYFRLNDRAAAVPDQLYLAFLYNFDFNKAAPTPGNSNPAPSTGTGPATSAPATGGPAPTNGGPAPAPAP